jgi:hypothetical protein
MENLKEYKVKLNWACLAVLLKRNQQQINDKFVKNNKNG